MSNFSTATHTCFQHLMQLCMPAGISTAIDHPSSSECAILEHSAGWQPVLQAYMHWGIFTERSQLAQHLQSPSCLPGECLLLVTGIC